MRRILKHAGVGVDKSNLVVTIWSLALILHLVANFWGVSATFNTESSDNWMALEGIKDASVVHRYLTSFYWSVVTTMTVGYGDIVPTNRYEKLLTCLILLLGVAINSFILSTLSN